MCRSSNEARTRPREPTNPVKCALLSTIIWRGLVDVAEVASASTLSTSQACRHRRVVSSAMPSSCLEPRHVCQLSLSSRWRKAPFHLFWRSRKCVSTAVRSSCRNWRNIWHNWLRRRTGNHDGGFGHLNVELEARYVRFSLLA